MRRHPALNLTIGLAVFYLFFGNLRTTSGDEEAMLQVTRALIERGRFDLPSGIIAPVDTILLPTSDTVIPYTLEGQEGRTFAKYGLGQSLAAAPLYLLGLALRAITGASLAPRLLALSFNALVTAATAGLLVTLAHTLRYSTRTALLVAILFAVSSFAWVYTKTFFSEPLVTFCLVLAAVSSVRFTALKQTRWLMVAGFALGYALLTRVDAVMALPAFGLYVLATWRQHHTSLREGAVQSVAGLSAFALGAGLTLAYNVLRFGTPFDFGYHTSNWQVPFLEGLYGLALSPGKGLLWYAPPVLLGVLGLPALARAHPREALLCAAVALGYLVGHASYTHWAGGWCWGPRLLLPALPFALLPACTLLDRRPARPWLELGLALILVLGLLVQVPAVGSYYARPLQRLYAEDAEGFNTRVLFRVADSPLLSQWRSLLEVTANVRDSEAHAAITALVSAADPAPQLLLVDSYRDAVHLEQQAILAFNVPDFWFVIEPWIRRVQAR